MMRTEKRLTDRIKNFQTGNKKNTPGQETKKKTLPDRKQKKNSPGQETKKHSPGQAPNFVTCRNNQEMSANKV